MKRFSRISLVCLMAATARADELTLGDALRTTLENNPAIQEAKASVERAGGRRLVLRAVALPDVEARLVGLGFEPFAATPDEVAALIRRELPKWAGVIRAAGIKPN